MAQEVWYDAWPDEDPQDEEYHETSSCPFHCWGYEDTDDNCSSHTSDGEDAADAGVSGEVEDDAADAEDTADAEDDLYGSDVEFEQDDPLICAIREILERNCEGINLVGVEGNAHILKVFYTALQELGIPATITIDGVTVDPDSIQFDPDVIYSELSAKIVNYSREGVREMRVNTFIDYQIQLDDDQVRELVMRWVRETDPAQCDIEDALAGLNLLWQGHIPRSIRENLKSLEQIGEGSFGRVYLYSESTMQRVALKHIKYRKYSVALEAVMKEANIHAALRHPNIINFFGYYQLDRSIILVLEYSERGSVRDLLRSNGRLEDNEILLYVKQILTGIEYLHGLAKPIVHRDITSTNIYISGNNFVKIGDFGISLQLGGPSSTVDVDLPYIVHWCSPELLQGKAGLKCDIWSLGIVILEMIYVTPPMFDIGSTQYMLRTKQLPEIPDFVDEKIQHILRLCLVWEQEKRSAAKEILKVMKGWE